MTTRKDPITYRDKQIVTKKAPQVTCRYPDCSRVLKATPTNFIKANAGLYPDSNNFYPYCNECLRKMLTNKDGTISEDGVRSILKDLNYPFFQAIYDTACAEWENLYGDRENCQEKVLTFYIKTIKNKPYSSMQWKDGEGVLKDGVLIDPSAPPTLEEIMVNVEDDDIVEDEQQEIKKPFRVTKDLVMFWGKLKNNQAYKLHQEEYEKLCEEDGGYIDVVKEHYFKNIVILKFLSQDQLAQKNIEGYIKTMKALQDACDKCGINPKNKIDREDANKGTYGTFIKMIENDHPILDPEKELGTIDYVRKVIEVFFFGHLANVLNLRNPVQAEYDEMMKEYSVKVDTWDDIANIQETPDEEKKEGRKLKVRIPKGFFRKMKDGEV